MPFFVCAALLDSQRCSRSCLGGILSLCRTLFALLVPIDASVSRARPSTRAVFDTVSVGALSWDALSERLNTLDAGSLVGSAAWNETKRAFRHEIRLVSTPDEHVADVQIVRLHKHVFLVRNLLTKEVFLVRVRTHPAALMRPSLCG